MSHSPEHAIRKWLQDFHPTAHAPGTEPSRMRPQTVQFVKHRDAPGAHMWFVTCEADGGSRGTERWRWTLEVSRDDHGRWTAHGVAGGGGRGDWPRRAQPWANMGGSWGPNRFRAGGTIEDAGARIARVRLTDIDGRTFEDTVENGVVLFSSDEPVEMPMRLELIDSEGRLISTDEWGFADE